MPALTQHRHVPSVILRTLHLLKHLIFTSLGDRKYNHTCFTDEKTEAMLETCQTNFPRDIWKWIHELTICRRRWQNSFVGTPEPI